MALAFGAAVAGASAAAAYIDAKYHISKDLDEIQRTKRGEWMWQKKEKENKRSLWYFFEDQAARLTTEPCIWSRAGCYTWTETHAQSCRYAQFMLSQGVQPGELVAFYLQNSAEFMFATVGSWAIGCAPALLNYNLGGEGLMHCLRLNRSKILLVDEDSDCRARIEEVRERIEGELGMKIVLLDSALKVQISAMEPRRPERKYRENIKGESPMCLIYTSGTTGHPKACPFQIQRAYPLAGPRIQSCGLHGGPNGDRWYDCMPMYHGTGFTVAVTCMTSGLTLCVGTKFSVSRFWQDIRDSDATAFVYVGETARYLLAAPESEWDKKHRVRVMFGNGLRPDVWRKFQERFGIETVSEFFNSTEGVFGLLNVCRGPYLQTAVGHHGAIIRLLLRNTYVPVEIDHESGDIWRDPKTGFARRVPHAEGGEIIVKVPSEQAFSGYWNAPEATAKKFTRNVFKKGDLYYRTGDALRRTEDGRWFFMDRLGDTFRWKSENVSTAEVAECLGHFPGVVEANVYGVEVPARMTKGHDGRAGCAALYIPPAARSTFDFAGLHRHARRKLPKYAVPLFLRLVADMAPMHNNKQNKVPLRREGVDPEKIAEGTAGPADVVYWAPPKAETYVVFGRREWDGLVAGRARL
ncbi:hypothetical protein LTR50_002682 [Elasticomyces elasticus]|nr:hypothetical protein LTR50_002682 [Elasticomyces elasticus]